jgi:hypothetical protein
MENFAPGKNAGRHSGTLCFYSDSEDFHIGYFLLLFFFCCCGAVRRLFALCAATFLIFRPVALENK